MWDRSPDDVALPGLALRTPEPESTPDAVWDAIPDVDAPPSLDPTTPAFLLITTLCGVLGIGSLLAFSLPRLEASVQ